MQKFNFNKVTSGLIVTLLLVTIVSFTGQVNAQAPPDMSNIPGAPKMVSGAYSNSDYGVQITFPDGWQGAEMKASVYTTVAVGPGSLDSSNTGSTSSVIMLAMGPLRTDTFTTDPNIPTDPKYKCDVLSSGDTNVNGMSATMSVVQCTSPEGNQKMKSYSFKTDKNDIFVSFMASPSSMYDSNVAAFDSAVKTLQIANTVSAPSTTQNTASNAAVPEFPTVTSLVLVVSILAIIGFTMVSRKNGLSLFGRN